MCKKKRAIQPDNMKNSEKQQHKLGAFDSMDNDHTKEPYRCT